MALPRTTNYIKLTHNKLSPQCTSIIEYRFFANMSIEEIAQVLSVSPSTVKRQWNKAKIWLYQQLQKKP